MTKQIIFALLVLAACKKHDAKTETAGSAAEPAKTTEPAPAGTPAAPAADGVMAAAKKAAAGCELQEGYYFKYDCEGKKDWSAFRFEAKHAASLVAVLEEPNAGLQNMASNQMMSNADWFANDKAMQERILAIATKIPKDAKGGTGNQLGRAIGFFNLEKTGLFDKAKAIVENPEANEGLRIGIVNWVLPGNQKNDAAYQLTLAQAKQTAEPKLRTAALVALSAGYAAHAADICPIWLDSLEKLDDRPGAMIASHLTIGDLQVNNQHEAFPYNWAMISSDDNRCPDATVDAALDIIDKRMTAGVQDSWWVTALKGPAKAKNATAGHKQKATAIATKYFNNSKNSAYQRGNALEVIAALDPVAGKALATKVADDKDLKDAAARVLKRLASNP
ncbi:MAG: hypothetical protein ABI867_00405 [Kofleriaceae bacterium]